MDDEWSDEIEAAFCRHVRALAAFAAEAAGDDRRARSMWRRFGEAQQAYGLLGGGEAERACGRYSGAERALANRAWWGMYQMALAMAKLEIASEPAAE